MSFSLNRLGCQRDVPRALLALAAASVDLQDYGTAATLLAECETAEPSLLGIVLISLSCSCLFASVVCLSGPEADYVRGRLALIQQRYTEAVTALQRCALAFRVVGDELAERDVCQLIEEISKRHATPTGAMSLLQPSIVASSAVTAAASAVMSAASASATGGTPLYALAPLRSDHEIRSGIGSLPPIRELQMLRQVAQVRCPVALLCVRSLVFGCSTCVALLLIRTSFTFESVVLNLLIRLRLSVFFFPSAIGISTAATTRSSASRRPTGCIREVRFPLRIAIRYWKAE